jgi:hypothetical protein
VPPCRAGAPGIPGSEENGWCRGTDATRRDDGSGLVDVNFFIHRSPTSPDATLHFQTEQESEYVIRLKGTTEVLWTWSSAGQFARTPSEVLIPSGSGLTWTLTWDTTLADGTKLKPGVYRVDAYSTATELDPSFSDYFEFTIPGAAASKSGATGEAPQVRTSGPGIT